MRIELAGREETYIGLRLQLSDTDIQRLITNLTNLRKEPGQHFHLSADLGPDVKCYVDIEISNQSDDSSEGTISGFALRPGSPIPGESGFQPK